MIARGRPLRFLFAVVGGWMGVRAALLWPAADLPEVVRTTLPLASMTQPPPAPPASSPQAAVLSAIAHVASPAHTQPHHMPRSMPLFRLDHPAVQPQLMKLALPAATVPLPVAGIGVPPAGIDPPPAFRLSRWSGSAWAIARPGGRATPFTSQLGGSQAGMRIAHALDGARRVAVYGRVSAAIDSRQQEGALGIDWRPTRAPVHVVVERRIGIAGIGSGTAAGVIGGFGPSPVGAGLRAEAYGQAGVIARDGAEGVAEGVADGSARLTRAFGRVDLGLGAWGGAQRGAARLDLGPTMSVGVPVAGRTLRLSADWRQRVAGSARPGSGPAVSLGVDF